MSQYTIITKVNEKKTTKMNYNNSSTVEDTIQQGLKTKRQSSEQVTCREALCTRIEKKVYLAKVSKFFNYSIELKFDTSGERSVIKNLTKIQKENFQRVIGYFFGRDTNYGSGIPNFIPFWELTNTGFKFTGGCFDKADISYLAYMFRLWRSGISGISKTKLSSAGLQNFLYEYEKFLIKRGDITMALYTNCKLLLRKNETIFMIGNGRGITTEDVQRWKLTYNGPAGFTSRYIRLNPMQAAKLYFTHKSALDSLYKTKAFSNGLYNVDSSTFPILLISKLTESRKTSLKKAVGL